MTRCPACFHRVEHPTIHLCPNRAAPTKQPAPYVPGVRAPRPPRPPARRVGRTPRFTPTDLRQAARMREQGHTWRTVAAALNLNPRDTPALRFAVAYQRRKTTNGRP